MIPVLVLGVPILDTSLVIVSRLRRGKNPFTTPGKDHLSHRLVKMGYTRREAVLLLYLLGSIFGMIAVFVTQASVLEAIVVGITLLIAALAVILYMEKMIRKAD
jgi:UDP-GlcNAc:undecaprenyl-phosphate GlcNAc-1-phosphate transferase